MKRFTALADMATTPMTLDTTATMTKTATCARDVGTLEQILL